MSKKSLTYFVCNVIIFHGKIGYYNKPIFNVRKRQLIQHVL